MENKPKRKYTRRNPQISFTGHRPQQWIIEPSRVKQYPYGIVLTSSLGLGDQKLCAVRTPDAAVRLADMLNSVGGFPKLTEDQKTIRLRAPRGSKVTA